MLGTLLSWHLLPGTQMLTGVCLRGLGEHAAWRLWSLWSQLSGTRPGPFSVEMLGRWCPAWEGCRLRAQGATVLGPGPQSATRARRAQGWAGGVRAASSQTVPCGARSRLPLRVLVHSGVPSGEPVRGPEPCAHGFVERVGQARWAGPLRRPRPEPSAHGVRGAPFSRGEWALEQRLLSGAPSAPRTPGSRQAAHRYLWWLGRALKPEACSSIPAETCR